MSIRKALEILVTTLGGEPTSKSIRGLVGDVSAALDGESNGRTVAEQIINVAIAKGYKPPAESEEVQEENPKD